jgi:hypothetical protein
VVSLLLIVDLRAVSSCVSSFYYHPMLIHLIDVILEHFTARQVWIEHLRGLPLPIRHDSTPRILRVAVTLVRGRRILHAILGLCKMHI